MDRHLSALTSQCQAQKRSPHIPAHAWSPRNVSLGLQGVGEQGQTRGQKTCISTQLEVYAVTQTQAGGCCSLGSSKPG
jgi:hypothetical protein